MQRRSEKSDGLERPETAEYGTREERMRQLGMALHELCQPLTTLQCRLEMAKMTGTIKGYREAVETGLAECERLCQAVTSMREIVRAVSRPMVDSEMRQEMRSVEDRSVVPAWSPMRGAR